MAVPVEAIKPGAVFQFKKAQRRVISNDRGSVRWEYADGVKRKGKIGGLQWIHYFRADATPTDQPVTKTYAAVVAERDELRWALNLVLDGLGALGNKTELYGYAINEQEADRIIAAARNA